VATVVVSPKKSVLMPYCYASKPCSKLSVDDPRKRSGTTTALRVIL